ncbi:hypothetical protein [Rhodoferax sp. PAMC 29310]|uniref:hypothetical protein n=1 Tax=Rhodoferax sp. PAMC 29310 TaxID=2822760 RepID=UPI001B3325C3|nr:hypothetical protein [Rhodoferax sp. PAMC 29310]
MAVVDPLAASVRTAELHAAALLTFIPNELFLRKRLDFSSNYPMAYFETGGRFDWNIQNKMDSRAIDVSIEMMKLMDTKKVRKLLIYQE